MRYSPGMTALLGPTSHYFYSQRLKLHYVDWGNAEKPPLLLIHGGRDHLLHPVRIRARVLQRDRAAERVADDRDLLDSERAQQLVDVERVVDHGVAAADRPLRVAVAAQVGGDDVEVAPQILRHPVPVAGVVAAAVDQQQRRLVGIPPVDVLQLEALGDEGVRGGADQRVHAAAYIAAREAGATVVAGRWSLVAGASR